MISKFNYTSYLHQKSYVVERFKIIKRVQLYLVFTPVINVGFFNFVSNKKIEASTSHVREHAQHMLEPAYYVPGILKDITDDHRACKINVIQINHIIQTYK